MNLSLNIKGLDDVAALLKTTPGKAQRACAVALNQTGKEIKVAEVAGMMSVFQNPTRYTLNALRLDTATAKGLSARVWFKEPDRMGQHYLIPQVEGGPRKLKGFERGIDMREFVPGKGVRLNQYGNISIGQIRQIMSVHGKAETSAGYMANITARSRKTNRKQRDYVYISNRNGKLLPGVYQRVQTGVGFGAKTKRTFTDQSKAYQKGNRKVALRDQHGKFMGWGLPRSKMVSVVRARGLKPILIAGRTGHAVKPLLDFYGIAHKTFERTFEACFWSTLNRFLQS